MATVLCIDNDSGGLATQKALLEGRGYSVLVASDGATGIEVSRKHSIDAVVLDCNIAGMDGSQFADVLMKEQPTLPVAISSDSLDYIPESLKWFADALVQRCDGPEALLLAIENLIAVISPVRKAPGRGSVRANEAD